jgi:hypothetical protein
MSIGLQSRRALLLNGPWVRNDLWRRARAVPSLDLRFADNKSLTDAVTGQSLVTFTRASSGTYVGSDGLIKTAATDTPRFDHNPATGESLGLLVEEARTNLLTYSEQFNNLAWSKFRLTVTQDAAIAPNNTITADKLVPNNGTTTGACYSLVTVTIGNSYVVSVYIKAAELGFAFVANNTRVSTTDAGVCVNLSTGAITNAGASGTYVVTNAGNGWWRVSCATTSTSSNAFFEIYPLAAAGTWNSSTGDGTSGIYIWGAQLEAGAFPTSYIPTTTASVTRSADVASIAGSNFSRWYNQSEGTMFGSIRTRAPASASNGFLFQFTDGTSNNRIELLQQGSGSAYLRISTLFRSLGVTTANFLNQEIGWAADGITVDNVALGWSSSGFILQTKFSPNPGTGSGSYPQNLNQVVFQHTGTIARLTYWPQRLSTLQAITQ